jgi:hypothetical protein
VIPPGQRTTPQVLRKRNDALSEAGGSDDTAKAG